MGIIFSFHTCISISFDEIHSTSFRKIGHINEKLGSKPSKKNQYVVEKNYSNVTFKKLLNPLKLNRAIEK
jgi:hypothetical protein